MQRTGRIMRKLLEELWEGEFMLLGFAKSFIGILDWFYDRLTVYS